MTEKRKRFCEEYVKDLNATQSAIRAGYSPRRAKQEGSELLAETELQDYIKQLQSEIAERNKISVDECVQILANIARADIAKFYDDKGSLKSIHDIEKADRDAIEELTVMEEFEGYGKERKSIGYSKKIKTSGKQAAIDKLLKHLGGYKEDNNQRQPVVNIMNVNPLSDDATSADDGS